MKFTKLCLFLASIGTLVTSSYSSALAANAQNNLTVTASVAANCTITAGTLAFGVYDPIVANATTPLDGSGTFTITCTAGTTTALGLDQGLHYANGTNNMVGGNQASSLKYGLFRTGPGVGPWGNSDPNRLTTAAQIDNNAQTITVYGRIPAGQVVSSGLPGYSDTVVATVNF